MIHRVIGRLGDRVIERVTAFTRRALVVVRAALREIFDESAYERFLARTDSERSVSSYRAFMLERENAMTRKQRCC
jgi:hypothetical protein